MGGVLHTAGGHLLFRSGQGEKPIPVQEQKSKRRCRFDGEGGRGGVPGPTWQPVPMSFSLPAWGCSSSSLSLSVSSQHT